MFFLRTPSFVGNKGIFGIFPKLRIMNFGGIKVIKKGGKAGFFSFPCLPPKKQVPLVGN
jgi:hypothetical protein